MFERNREALERLQHSSIPKFLYQITEVKDAPKLSKQKLKKDTLSWKLFKFCAKANIIWKHASVLKNLITSCGLKFK